MAKREVINIETARNRNELAKEGLETYYQNALRRNEELCATDKCPHPDWHDTCGGCDWKDFETCGWWTLYSDVDKLKELYEEADYAYDEAFPIKHSEIIGDSIVKNDNGEYISGNLEVVAEELMPWCSLCYIYNYVGNDYHDHGHSFSNVIQGVLWDPVNFYIPLWGVKDYSFQELKYLELFRAYLCNKLNKKPKCDFILCDEESKEKLFDKEIGVNYYKKINSLIDELVDSITDDESKNKE